MNTQVNLYFRNMAEASSPKSQKLSKALAGQATQKLLNSFIQIVNSSSKDMRNDSSDLQNNPQNRLPQIIEEESVKRLQEKPQNNSEKNQSEVKSSQREDEQIRKINEKLVLVKKSRKYFEILELDAFERLKKMKIEKEIIGCIRQEQDLKRELEYWKEEKQRKQQIVEKKMAQKNQKKQKILKNLEELEERRRKRETILQVKSLPVIPRFKIMERVFLMQEMKHQLDNKAYQKHIHEMRYKDYLQHSRLSEVPSKNKSKKRLKTEADCSKPVNAKELQQSRRKILVLLQQKRKQLALSIDKQKSKKLDILKDKSQHPQKYHYLKMKNVTEEQIFKDFQDFEMEFDGKNLGKKYLQESKALIKKDEVSGALEKSRIKSLPNQFKVSEKQRSYEKSNIDRSKMKGKSRKQLLGSSQKKSRISEGRKGYSQLDKILRESESKSKVIQLLSKQSANNEKSIAEMAKLLSKPAQYQDCLNIESSMDSEYLQFLKSKITALGLQLH